MPSLNQTNPGLQPYDLSHYRGVSGQNFYYLDRELQRIISRHVAKESQQYQQDVEKHIAGYGELVGSVLNELTDKAHKEGKYGEIVNYDRFGNRIEEVQYCAEQLESRKISYEYGIVNLDFHPEWQHPFRQTHRMALAYLANLNGEGGVTCPLAMTEGMIDAIQKIGTAEQKEKYLPLVAGKDSTSYFMAGQYVTERVGGSNVAANRTIAVKQEDGKYKLYGEKWFCSNPGDLWVTTAKIAGTNTIGLFLAPRYKDNGELNDYSLLRKKDIIGSRGKLTAECSYDGLEAEALGKPSHGLANLVKYVICVSRNHVAVAAGGMSRRAVMEAISYAHAREAYGKKINDFTAIKRKLTELYIEQAVLTLVMFRSFQLAEQEHRAQAVYNPLMKYIATITASKISHEAILILGGNGIIGDFSILPRLHNDSIINETWEGTHHIVTEHALHALKRPKVKQAFDELMEMQLKGSENFSKLQPLVTAFYQQKKWLENCIQTADKQWLIDNRLAICQRLYQIIAISELVEQAIYEKTNLPVEKQNDYERMAIAYLEILESQKTGLTDPNGILAQADVLNFFIKSGCYQQ